MAARGILRGPIGRSRRVLVAAALTTLAALGAAIAVPPAQAQAQAQAQAPAPAQTQVPARIAPEAGEVEILAAVTAYLEAIDTLRADFTQFAPNGESATGVLWISRPGRLRIDYDPPSRILLVATDWRLVFYDSAIEQMNTIPLSETPLGFILEEEVDLAGAVMVTGIAREAGMTMVSVSRRDAPDQGSVTLWFRDEPIELRRWTVIDPQGLETTVVLESLRTDLEPDDRLFFAPNPRTFGWPD